MTSETFHLVSLFGGDDVVVSNNIFNGANNRFQGACAAPGSATPPRP